MTTVEMRDQGVEGRVSPAAAGRDRSALLDCIRAGAIIGVVVFHVAKLYDPAELDALGTFFRRFGLLGVDVFFPLSGYLIVRFLMQARAPGSTAVFFQRRFFRIVPLYLVAVTIFLVANMALAPTAERLDRIWIPYAFLTGWFIFLDGVETVPYTISWSLSVEEFAYVLFGLWAWANRSSLPVFLVVVSLGALGLRAWLHHLGADGVYNFPPARLDSIAIGGLAAVLADRYRLRHLDLAFLAATAVLFAFAFHVPATWETLKYTFIAFGTCALILLFETRLRHVGGSNPILRLAALIGFHSYFTYLFHLFNIHALVILWDRVSPDAPMPFWALVAVSLALTQVQAVLSYRLFEGPLIRFGRRLEKARVH